METYGVQTYHLIVVFSEKRLTDDRKGVAVEVHLGVKVLDELLLSD
jgi:hypothetical protein